MKVVKYYREKKDIQNVAVVHKHRESREKSHISEFPVSNYGPLYHILIPSWKIV